MNALNYSKTNRALTDKEMQQMNYLFAIYSAEVFAGQDVYCPKLVKTSNKQLAQPSSL